jgi:hypothetical protein
VKRKRLLEGQGYDETPADEDTRLFRPGSQRDSAGAAVAAAQGDVDEQQRLAKIVRVNPRVNLLAHESDSLMKGFGVVHATSKVRDLAEEQIPYFSKTCILRVIMYYYVCYYILCVNLCHNLRNMCLLCLLFITTYQQHVHHAP